GAEAAEFQAGKVAHLVPPARRRDVGVGGRGRRRPAVRGRAVPPEASLCRTTRRVSTASGPGRARRIDIPAAACYTPACFAGPGPAPPAGPTPPPARKPGALMSMKIPVASTDLGGNEERYVVDAIRSSWISSTGPYLSRFEREYA